MTAQLALDLALRPALGRDAFLVSGSNAEALAAIEAPERWPSGRLALVGPPSSGKTHLAAVWAAMTGAAIVAASALDPAAVPGLSARPLVIEDGDRPAPEGVPGDPSREAALLHLLNAAAEAGVPLILTARQPPGRWRVALPDLASRLAATAVARLAEPDGALLGALLAKLFRDRQVAVHPDLVPFLVRRIERSGSAAERIAALLDRASLGARRPLTVPFARQMLGW
jgi:chromosomal replication initiation ATPase DnaA